MFDLNLATDADVDDCIDLTLEHVSRYGYSPNYRKIEATVLHCVHHPDGIAVLARQGDAPVGLIMGVQEEVSFANDVIAKAVIWYSKAPGAGQKLRQAFEYWAQRMGCTEVIVGTFDPRLNPIMPRYGYSSIETAHRKVL